jgi:hypothetical protein
MLDMRVYVDVMTNGTKTVQQSSVTLNERQHNALHIPSW